MLPLSNTDQLPHHTIRNRFYRIKPVFSKWTELFDIIFISILSIATRFFVLGNPAEVQFDEVHFGFFTNEYYNGLYFFDIHPPLGKLILYWGSLFLGYGKGVVRNENTDTDDWNTVPPNLCDFRNIGNNLSNCDYMHLRVVAASFASTLAPLSYCLVRSLSGSRIAAWFAALCLIMDNSFIVEGRLIVTDSILFCFILCTAVFSARLKNSQIEQILIYLEGYTAEVDKEPTIYEKSKNQSDLGIVIIYEEIKSRFSSIIGIYSKDPAVTRDLMVNLIFTGIFFAFTSSCKWVPGAALCVHIAIQNALLPLATMFMHYVTVDEAPRKRLPVQTKRTKSSDTEDSESTPTQLDSDANNNNPQAELRKPVSPPTSPRSYPQPAFTVGIIMKNFFLYGFFLLIVPIIIYFYFFYLHYAASPYHGHGDAFISEDHLRALIVSKGEQPNPFPSLWLFIERVIYLNRDMYINSMYNTGSHPYGTKWYTWLYMERGVYYWGEDVPNRDETRQVYLLGNPLAWWFLLIMLCIFLISCISYVLANIKKIRHIDRFIKWYYMDYDNRNGHYFYHDAYSLKVRACLDLFFLYFINLVPYVMVIRSTFLYHYMPALLFGYALLAVYMIDLILNTKTETDPPLMADNTMSLPIEEPVEARLSFNSKLFLIGVVAFIAYGFCYFAPLSYGLILPRSTLEQNFWLRSWR